MSTKYIYILFTNNYIYWFIYRLFTFCSKLKQDENKSEHAEIGSQSFFKQKWKYSVRVRVSLFVTILPYLVKQTKTQYPRNF